MKKNAFWIIFILFFSFLMVAQDEILNLGNVQFPRSFIHAQKNYDKGIYRFFLTSKTDPPYFKVFNRKNEFLFEELAIKKPYAGKSQKFNYRVKSDFLKGFEYFRIQVTRPDNIYLAFFILQKTEGGEKEAEKPLPEAQTEIKTD